MSDDQPCTKCGMYACLCHFMKSAPPETQEEQALCEVNGVVMRKADRDALTPAPPEASKLNDVVPETLSPNDFIRAAYCFKCRKDTPTREGDCVECGLSKQSDPAPDQNSASLNVAINDSDVDRPARLSQKQSAKILLQTKKELGDLLEPEAAKAREWWIEMVERENDEGETIVEPVLWTFDPGEPFNARLQPAIEALLNIIETQEAALKLYQQGWRTVGTHELDAGGRRVTKWRNPSLDFIGPEFADEAFRQTDQALAALGDLCKEAALDER